MNSFRYKFLLIIFFAFVFFPFKGEATVLDFNVDSDYDYKGRSEITAFLNKIGEHAYFFVEDNYYNSLSADNKKIFSDSIKALSDEFDNVIYPQLTALYGYEWKPGIDNDDRITVLLSKFNTNSGGYFYSGDEYPVAQVMNSNEREMIYFNVDYVSDPLAKSYLAHEFMHLINFNQKERSYGVEEDVWLNEGRAEMASTLLGYDDVYNNSALQKRVKTFLQNPSDSLTEWKGDVADYGVLNIFMQYLVDHYGSKILVDSLNSSKTGIDSLNYALIKNGYEENFYQVFSNWTIALLVNDCSLGEIYCFYRDGLTNLKVIPRLNYLPMSGESTLTMTDYSKNWTSNWIKFIGGNGTLELEFVGDERTTFKVPYVIKNSNGTYSIGYFNLDGTTTGKIYIENFGNIYDSITIIPSIQGEIRGFNNLENYYKFIWSASILNENSNDNENLVSQLTAQIEYLKNEIAKVQAQIAAILNQKSSCQFDNNLYYGMSNNNDVECLQQFLKNQGSEIYPEGIVTGNFYDLTLQAVVRFQEKYASEILYPVGLQKGTGFVGVMTRDKINQLLGN